MPLYDGDLEEELGLPDHAITLKKLFAEQAGFFITSPEYNSSFTPLFKNTIDWISRPNPSDSSMADPYKGKTAAIAGSSPGGLGGMRALVPLRMLLGNIGIHVMPTQMALNFAGKAFDDNGNLSDEGQLGMLHNTLEELINVTRTLQN